MDRIPPTEEEAPRGTDRGVLWRFTRDGHSGYLYGTIHVGKREWQYLSPLIRQVLQESDVLAVELDLTDPTIIRDMQARQPREETPQLHAAVWNQLHIHSRTCPAPWEILRTLPPVLIATVCVMHTAVRDGFTPQYGSELTLLPMARRLHKPIVMLETVTIQRAALMGYPPEEQRTMIERYVSAIETGKTRENLCAIAEAWNRGDLVP